MRVLKIQTPSLILTEWIEYSNIDWERVSKMMRKPAWVFDARSISNSDKVKDANISFWRVEMAPNQI